MNLFKTPLTDRFISITGQDSIKFLQGQASCDLNELTENNFTYGTLNSPKGRIYCLFKVIKTEDGLLLAMHESLLEPTLQKLSKYAVFFKCTLQEDQSYRAFGIWSNEQDGYANYLREVNLNSQVNSSVHDHDTYWLNISTRNKLSIAWVKQNSTLPTLVDQSEDLSLNNWLCLETMCGIPELYNNSQDEFILQYINLQQLGAVSFKKGCYTGQEIIARMKFLGKQKKQAYLLHSDQKEVQAPLAPVYNSDGMKCGTLIRSHWSQDTGSVALCILPIESALSYGSIFLSENNDVAFNVKEIDYSEFKK